MRLGQEREVTVIKYSMNDTVESKNVQHKQKKKLRLADRFHVSKQSLFECGTNVPYVK